MFSLYLFNPYFSLLSSKACISVMKDGEKSASRRIVPEASLGSGPTTEAEEGNKETTELNAVSFFHVHI